MKRVLIFTVFCLAVSAWGQQIKLPPELEKLASKASEVVDINLDKSMLQFASGFMADPHDRQARDFIRNLNGIYVKSFEFSEPGQYNAAALESVRSQLRAPLWSRIVGAHSKRDQEDVDIFLRKENGKVTGMVVLAAEPKELTLVSIDGPINPEDIAQLGGQFGIPQIEIENKAGASKQPEGKAAPK